MIAFPEFAKVKKREAERADIAPLVTLSRTPLDATLAGVGNDWTREKYDGEFRLFTPPEALPAVSLVFVQSREGNTGAHNPEELGGGPTDKHLIYEGLSRVAADGVLAGAATASGADVFFSVWHPRLVELRRSLGLAEHPAQIVVSGKGPVDLEGTRLFNVPEVPVFVLLGITCRQACAAALAQRPWIVVLPFEPGGLREALSRLRRDHGINRISAVGGRTTASALIDEGLVQDLCLTTTGRSAGEPDTPFYTGEIPPRLQTIVRKRGTDPESPILFEHLAVSAEETHGTEGTEGTSVSSSPLPAPVRTGATFAQL